MTTLHSAIALVHMNVVAKLVTKNLHFDMPRMYYILFYDHMVIVETFHCLALCRLKLFMKISLRLYNSHAFATTSKRGFQHHWETNLTGLLEQKFRVLLIAMIALKNRHSCLLHDLFTFRLGAHFADG